VLDRYPPFTTLAGNKSVARSALGIDGGVVLLQAFFMLFAAIRGAAQFGFQFAHRASPF